MRHILDRAGVRSWSHVLTCAAILSITGPFALDVAAQIMVAPPVVTMSDANRISHYLVHNASNEAHEVSVDFRFGYPSTDEDGSSRMVYDDLDAAARHSIAESVRAFPRQFVLQPGQRQRVRVMLTGDRELEEGGHWARIVTSAVPVSTPVDTIGDGQITTRIAIRTNTVTALMYHRGNAETGVQIDDLDAEISNGSVALHAQLRRTGNAPFLGRRVIRVRDGQGSVVHESTSNVAVYFDQNRVFPLSLPEVPPGEYEVELQFEATRSDVPRSELLPIEPVSASVALVLPPG